MLESKRAAEIGHKITKMLSEENIDVGDCIRILVTCFIEYADFIKMTDDDMKNFCDHIRDVFINRHID